MTEYELVDAISSYATQGGTFITIWVTFVSAYALVAYTAGENLQRSQLVWLNGLYIFASLLAIYGFTGSWLSQVYYVEQLKELNPKSPQSMNTSMVITSTAFAFSGTFITMKFMWDVRHAKKSAT
jgi:hypothetical protein